MVLRALLRDTKGVKDVLGIGIRHSAVALVLSFVLGCETVPREDIIADTKEAGGVERWGADDGTWTVDCGLPLADDSILALLPTGGYTGPWRGVPNGGHLEVKTLHRRSPERGVVTEMWLLSHTVGWWRLKAMWVHPDDLGQLDEILFGDASMSGVRQVIDSPFLSGPAVVRAGHPDDEDLVNGQILAMLPGASRLRCGPPSEGTN